MTIAIGNMLGALSGGVARTSMECSPRAHSRYSEELCPACEPEQTRFPRSTPSSSSESFQRRCSIHLSIFFSFLIFFSSTIFFPFFIFFLFFLSFSFFVFFIRTFPTHFSFRGKTYLHSFFRAKKKNIAGVYV